ncbi:MAG: D-aminoacyl-tRNA deacylase [Bacteroidota bacterium]
MRALVQRVKNAAVIIDGKQYSSIEKGLLVFLGVGEKDEESDLEWLAGKISQMRIFDDEKGVMNLSLKEIGGDLLLVSQFTLMASTAKGNRPSYIRAARPEKAVPLYKQMISRLSEITGKQVQSGLFGADMQVQLINDGPVTIFIDSANKE